jgi:hypothetical protein
LPSSALITASSTVLLQFRQNPHKRRNQPMDTLRQQRPRKPRPRHLLPDLAPDSFLLVQFLSQTITGLIAVGGERSHALVQFSITDAELFAGNC